MKTEVRRSREEIEANFNLINLDNIFHEDDPLSESIKEREIPSLYRTHNAECGGLSPSNDDGGNGGGNIDAGESDDEGEQMHNDPYEEMSLHRHDRNLNNLTMSRSGVVHSSDSFNDYSRIES
ncbi:hypothetical protein Lal_00039847 [Lupinus albus]|nr:hypothetical protein Lal_00039847 [Lupinus albus]